MTPSLTTAVEKAARAMTREFDEMGRVFDEHQADDLTRACLLAFLKEVGVTEEMVDGGRVQFWCDPEERDLNEGTKAAWEAMKSALITALEGE